MKWKQRGKVYIAAAWVGGQPFVFVQTLKQGQVTGEVFAVPASFAAEFEAVSTTHGRDPAAVRKNLERWAAVAAAVRNELDQADRGG